MNDINMNDAALQTNLSGDELIEQMEASGADPEDISFVRTLLRERPGAVALAAGALGLVAGSAAMHLYAGHRSNQTEILRLMARMSGLQADIAELSAKAAGGGFLSGMPLVGSKSRLESKRKELDDVKEKIRLAEAAKADIYREVSRNDPAMRRQSQRHALDLLGISLEGLSSQEVDVMVNVLVGSATAYLTVRNAPKADAPTEPTTANMGTASGTPAAWKPVAPAPVAPAPVAPLPEGVTSK